MKWYEHPETKIRGYWLKPPYDNILVACDPLDGMTKETADSFDAFINVSDSVCNTFQPSRPGQAMHWYPVNELGMWNLSYLFWLKKVLDYHYDAGHKIYLHCHAGAYRSPSAAVLWLQSRGLDEGQALFFGKEPESGLYRLWKSYGNIPKLKDQVFKLMREHPTWSLGGVLHHTGDDWNTEVSSGHYRIVTLKHRYFWFYYKPKYAIRSAHQWLEQWFKRCGYYREGCGTYYYRRKYFWVLPRNAEPMDPKEDIVYGMHWCPIKKTFVNSEQKG